MLREGDRLRKRGREGGRELMWGEGQEERERGRRLLIKGVRKVEDWVKREGNRLSK